MFSGTLSLLPGGSTTGGTSGSGTLSLLPGGGGTSGTLSLLPTYSYSAPSYTYGSSYSYQSAYPAYSLPGTGLQAGPFGDRGPYTPLDYPLIHELLPGQRLEDVNYASSGSGSSILPYLALGIIAALLLK